jgi:hypothetical protein
MPHRGSSDMAWVRNMPGEKDGALPLSTHPFGDVDLILTAATALLLMALSWLPDFRDLHDDELLDFKLPFIQWLSVEHYFLQVPFTVLLSAAIATAYFALRRADVVEVLSSGIRWRRLFCTAFAPWKNVFMLSDQQLVISPTEVRVMPYVNYLPPEIGATVHITLRGRVSLNELIRQIRQQHELCDER